MPITKFLQRTLMLGVLSCSLFTLEAAPQTTHDAESIADLFYMLNGDKNDPHKKINHTKGFCASGSFMPAKNITKTFDIPLFKDKNIQTHVRYSAGGGNPNASDKAKPRGMALHMEGKNDSWTIVMTNNEIQFAKDPNEFGQFLAIRVPKNGKVDSAKIAKVTNEVHSFKNFEEYLKTLGITASVGNTIYHSTHTFYFKDKKSKEYIPTRFKFVPVDGEKRLNESELKALNDNFLEDGFKEQIAKKPIQYKMILVLANPDDPILDVTALWKGKHKEIEFGTLEVNKYDGYGCNRDVYMPNELPSGVEPPQDALFDVRNEAYSITFGRRQ